MKSTTPTECGTPECELTPSLGCIHVHLLLIVLHLPTFATTCRALLNLLGAGVEP